MSDKQFNFWYAVNNTQVLVMPSRRLETFGTTMVNYHLVTELMDSVNRVRVREGRIKAFRPEILTPQSFMQALLENFGSAAQEYANWLRQHENQLHILRYGFTIAKQETSEQVLSDRMEAIVERVRQAMAAKDDPLGALVVGVDQPWEVCLLKLMVEVIQQSAPGNIQDFRNKDLLPVNKGDPESVRRYIEHAFHEAVNDPSRVNDLAAKLQKFGLFEEYQDRFFALLRQKRK